MSDNTVEPAAEESEGVVQVPPEPRVDVIAQRLFQSWAGVVEGALTAAVSHPASSEADRPALVKAVRKATKTGRAFLRLLRDCMSPEANAGAERLLRDASSLLSPIRDRDAMYETIARLLEGKTTERAAQAKQILTSLVTPPAVGDDQAAFEIALVRRAAALIAKADEIIRQVASEEVTLDRIADAFSAQWRRARRQANRNWRRDEDDAHDVRKACSRLMHQLGLIESNVSKSLRKLRQRIRKANATLGDEHDLALLTQTVELHRAEYGPTFVDAVQSACSRRREQLRRQATVALVEAMTIRPNELGRRVRRSFAS